jgi:CheY-like chemotaxis protein/HEAT repeat protein
VSRIDPRHFIEELRFDIQTQDKIKARLVLDHFADVDDSYQKMALLELSRAPEGFVIPLLVGVLAALSHLCDHHLRFKEILFSKALDKPQVLIQQLMREIKPDNRAVLAETAGEIRLESAMTVLLGIVNEEHDERVLRGAITALGMIGNSMAVTPISEFLYSGSVELIIAAIQALGQLSTPTALQRLAEKLGADPDLDNMILDVFACSQQPEALQRINATLSAQSAHLRNAGKKRMFEIGPKSVPVLIANLRYDDPDLLIHSLNILGDIGDESAIAPIRKLLHNEPEDPNVRFAAYEALGKLPVAKGAFALAQGMLDPVDNVRAAAAHAIDHNYNTVLAAGIKNMIRDENGAERPISRTIMDAQCDTILLDLVQDEFYRQFAVEYLCHQAHADTHRHFLDLLKSSGSDRIADQLAARTETGIDRRKSLLVFAVDDSKMVLNIYRSVLHNIGCDPVLFEFPADAIKQVKIKKPDLIFTDLNMPEINGLNLSRAVRQLYKRHELPIIMVTTQNDCQDTETAHSAGINAVLHKPFNEQTLRAAIEKLLR